MPFRSKIEKRKCRSLARQRTATEQTLDREEGKLTWEEFHARQESYHRDATRRISDPTAYIAITNWRPKKMTKELFTTRLNYSRDELKGRADELGINVTDLVNQGVRFMFEVSPFFLNFIQKSADRLGISTHLYLEKMFFELGAKNEANAKKTGDRPERWIAFGLDRQGKELLDTLVEYYETLEEEEEIQRHLKAKDYEWLEQKTMENAKKRTEKGKNKLQKITTFLTVGEDEYKRRQTIGAKMDKMKKEGKLVTSHLYLGEAEKAEHERKQKPK